MFTTIKSLIGNCCNNLTQGIPLMGNPLCQKPPMCDSMATWRYLPDKDSHILEGPISAEKKTAPKKIYA